MLVFPWEQNNYFVALVFSLCSCLTASAACLSLGWFLSLFELIGQCYSRQGKEVGKNYQNRLSDALVFNQ